MLGIIFGQIIRKVRISRDLSQQKLAYKANLDRTYISLLERGLRMPTLDTVFKISKALEVRPHELIKELEDRYENIN